VLTVSKSMHRDVLSAYSANAARIFAWFIVSALVYRRLGASAFALLAFVRGTIGIVNYASAGLSPALIRLLAESHTPQPVIPIADSTVLDYARPTHATRTRVYLNGIAAGLILCAIGLVVLAGYVTWINFSHSLMKLDSQAQLFAALFGLGVLCRLLSDAPSAVLQTSGHIEVDNGILIITELVWACLVAILLLFTFDLHIQFAQAIGGTFLFSSAVLLATRWLVARFTFPIKTLGFFRNLNPALLKRLLSNGLLLSTAQVADYLYAPTDYILIWALLNASISAAYSPAVQIDGGLLLLVTGLSSVLLPKAALAHTSGDHLRLRRYYLRGTLASAAILLLAALTIWLAAPLIFKLWFNNPMLATQAILPLVLIHTVIGGSSAVGRSILLGMGKVKPFTLAVLLGGISNVILSFVFVRYLHLGLRGIVLGTICAVIARCLIWMPWYVMRSLRSERLPIPSPLAG
jgi:O-antigen/teichoic acid export membrane protein